ncbi:MAG: bifunctional 5,10-methylenetetrahydrofolate dehydrogenase/5,10-methenyltetrahydrofolate cyclohydrolase [Coriobacteriaceae bacterium]|nr:bifunctional 5,10-methylenetetrahydrofolate dehydrogenase/5,10-methenyltetrahydrofolate cyclohydrolase [Coriobacteriaceae bacterium]
MAQVLSGRDVAASINVQVLEESLRLQVAGVQPGLGILRVGERDDDLSYERGALKRAEACGVSVSRVLLPADCSQHELEQAICQLNTDPAVHGILMFRPLPRHLDQAAAEALLAPAKDVDGITRGSLATVFAGGGEGYAPCTAAACMEILGHYGIGCAGKRAAVIGRSLVVGRPVAMMLMQENATPVICHTRTNDAAAITRQADIVIVAAGRMETIGPEYFSAGQVVIDVGIGWNEEKGKLCGDVRFDEVEPLVGAITPVPGGVGAVTTSVLMKHVVQAAAARLG